MSRSVTVAVDGDSFPAKPGARLLDAALAAGADIPHECRSGQCGTCMVRVVDGHVLGGRCGVPGSVLACQAVVLSDASIAVETTPPVVGVGATVEAVTALSRDVVEVTLATAAPFAWYAGQYAGIRFAGYPARLYSPTVALDGSDRPGTFRLHVKRLASGRVSAALGREICPGHRVSIEGPFGSAWLRPGSNDRLALFAGGTGFAPVWAIADAALCECPTRRLLVVAGVRTLETLYMAEALARLAQCPNVTVLPLTAEPQSVSAAIATGRAADFGHLIEAGDVVHAAGASAMVERLSHAAAGVGATFHADPFLPSGAAPRRSLRAMLAAGLRARPAGHLSSPIHPASAGSR